VKINLISREHSLLAVFQTHDTDLVWLLTHDIARWLVLRQPMDAVPIDGGWSRLSSRVSSLLHDRCGHSDARYATAEIRACAVQWALLAAIGVRRFSRSDTYGRIAQGTNLGHTGFERVEEYARRPRVQQYAAAFTRWLDARTP